METPLRANETPDPEVTLKGVRPNIVQSIRAFRVQDLQDAARSLGHHFLYANLANAQTKQDVLDLIAQQFILPAHFGKNFDALY
ncbi:MAG TPA: barstar family protein, partial [Ramlibacter sp.]|nr:barstar family protein [Ramlibacter sp.]